MTSQHAIFFTFPFDIPTNEKARRAFLENIIALKSSGKRYEDHIDLWFNKADMIEKDRDVKFARQAATFNYLINNMNLFDQHKIKGAYFPGDPGFQQLQQQVQTALVDTFQDCATRCGNHILDRERTYITLILRSQSGSIPRHGITTTNVLDKIRIAAKIDKAIYDNIIPTGRHESVDMSERFNWTILATKDTNDKGLIQQIEQMFKGDTDLQPAIQTLRDNWTANKPPHKHPKFRQANGRFLPDGMGVPVPGPKSLDAALTAFDLAVNVPPAVAIDDAFLDIYPGRKASDPGRGTPQEFLDSYASQPPPRPVTAKPNTQKLSLVDAAQGQIINTFDHAVQELTFHYRNELIHARLPEFSTTIVAGPIIFHNGNFLFDMDYSPARPGFNPKDTKIWDECSPEELEKCFRGVEAFDQAFNDYIRTHSKQKAQAAFATGIMSFLAKKKLPSYHTQVVAITDPTIQDLVRNGNDTHQMGSGRRRP